MDYETITVKPLTGALGAEIAGVDLREPLSNRQRSEIHDAFLAHCAIYIRDQELGGADLLRYARYFAEPGFAICERDYFIRGATVVGYSEHGSDPHCTRHAGNTQ